MTRNTEESDVVIQIALNALREIQRVFAASGIMEEELQEEGRRVREEIVRERYGER